MSPQRLFLLLPPNLAASLSEQDWLPNSQRTLKTSVHISEKLIYPCFIYIFSFPNKSFIFLILFYSLYFVIVLSFWLVPPPFLFLFSVVVLFYLIAVVSIIFLFFLTYFLSL